MESGKNRMMLSDFKHDSDLDIMGQQLDRAPFQKTVLYVCLYLLTRVIVIISKTLGPE